MVCLENIFNWQSRYLNEYGNQKPSARFRVRGRAARFVGSVRYGFYVGLIPIQFSFTRFEERRKAAGYYTHLRIKELWMNTSLPQWDLRSIYESFDAPEYRRDQELLVEKMTAFLSSLDSTIPDDHTAAAEHIVSLIKFYEEAGDIAENLSSYAAAVYTANTRDTRALNEINKLDELTMPFGKALVIFRGRLAEKNDLVLALAESNEKLKPYSFFIREALKQSAYQMSPEMEDLANDLARSGGDSWSRLQEIISSTTSILWDPVTGERKTVFSLRDMAHHHDRSIREKAYWAELDAWKSVEIPLSASLNGVKGTAITVDTRRGWKSALEKSAFQFRMNISTLDTLISALENSLPMFRRYLKTKAKILGIKTCAFYDLFAPVGTYLKQWSWKEAVRFIPEQFDLFDPAMGNFARHAFRLSWIDAEGGRDGKVGGAYCTEFPLTGESRILCNFEGSFDSIITLAHELGHAWHHEVVKNQSRTQTGYPMTLAETASIFAETLVLDAALKKSGPEERLSLIEEDLKGCCQVIVDILSRFYFEKNLFEKRSGARIPPAELCDMMIDVQKQTYGDGLDEDKLHPYMWAVKSHYYSTSMPFYNYPYAFGQLFALGLYSKAKKDGSAFAETYKSILRLTGTASAEDVALSAGFDIGDRAFWESGLAVIETRVNDFEKLAGEMLA